MIDLEYLRQLIARSGYQHKDLAHFMQMNDNTLRYKLRGKSDFRIAEAQRLSRLLNMTPDETARCFWPAEKKEKHHDI